MFLKLMQRRKKIDDDDAVHKLSLIYSRSLQI